MQAILKSERCKEANLSSLFMAIVIGSIIPTSLIENAKKIIPRCVMLTGYAMTEVPTGVTIALSDELIKNPKCVGYCVPGVQIKIINEITGENCGIDEEGELCVKGPIPPLGYFRDEVATKNAFDEENYFITGDIGAFDESGRLRIVGRKKEIFKNRGYSITPSEIEDVILKHPAVQSACVVSVFDEEVVTDLPAAVVIRKDQQSITEDEIYSLVAGKNANASGHVFKMKINFCFLLTFRSAGNLQAPRRRHLLC